MNGKIGETLLHFLIPSLPRGSFFHTSPAPAPDHGIVLVRRANRPLPFLSLLSTGPQVMWHRLGTLSRTIHERMIE